jgi:hypothetical protein
MDSDYGVPRELSEVQKKRTLYQPDLPPCLQVRPITATSSSTPARARSAPRGTRSRIVLRPDRARRRLACFRFVS